MAFSVTNFNSKYIDGEEYAYIPGYDGYYISKSGKLLGKRNKLINCITNTGNLNYPVYGVYLNNKCTTVPVHKLLALAWLPLPDGYDYSDVINTYHSRTLIVDHIDHNKYNNDLSNLKWMTPLENASTETRGAKKGNKNALGKKKSTHSGSYYYIYQNEYYTLKTIMQKLNCSKSKITESFRRNLGLVKTGELTRVLKKDTNKE